MNLKRKFNYPDNLNKNDLSHKGQSYCLIENSTKEAQIDKFDDKLLNIIFDCPYESELVIKHFGYLKVMFILVAFFIVGLIVSSAFNVNNLNRSTSDLDNVNVIDNSLSTDQLISQKYTANTNSNLFYDLTLTHNENSIKKPIFFHFITNKSSRHSNSLRSHKNKISSLNGHRINRPFYRHINQFDSNINPISKSIIHSHTFSRSFNQQDYLQRFMLSNSTSAKCNDGTDASYYFKRGKNSKWIIFLEGGGFCFNLYGCQERWRNQMRNLMSSAHWPERKILNGFLSTKKEENQFYYDSNFVYIGYCSSDGWSGDRPAQSNKGLHFSGSKIIENVIKDLIPKGLVDSSLVFFAGSSAGATGVLINIDKITDMIKEINPRSKVLGLIDSGWFLDNVPFRFQSSSTFTRDQKIDDSCSENQQICSPIETIKKGFTFWRAQLPKSCTNTYPDDEHWKCFFGYRLLVNMKTPIFVMQYLFDEAQMTVLNVAIPSTKAQWHYVYRMGLQMRNSLRNVSGLFAPSCISHIMLTKKNWNQMKINGISLEEAIKCWESKQMNNLENRFNLLNIDQRRIQSNAMKNEVNMISPLHSNNYYHSNVYPTMYKYKESNQIYNKLYRSEKRKSKINKSKPMNKRMKLNEIQLNDESLYSGQCSARLIEDCTFPQCNFDQCPKIKNFYTGKDINFLDLLKAFGVKLKLNSI